MKPFEKRSYSINQNTIDIYDGGLQGQNRLISNIVKRSLYNRKDSDLKVSNNGVEIDLIQFSIPLEKVHSMLVEAKDILSF